MEFLREGSMGVRKNAKFLTPPERESLVRAFVMMKADIVNPAAPVADRYSRWDQYVAIHRLIQSVNTPSAIAVNFGHGGSGAYGFCSWHRYFLYLLEQQLQTYVPGVMLPYWDWTDPTGTLLVADFLGPNGNAGSSYEVRQGYFAKEAPGTGINTTATPAWWPVGLSGWNLHPAFGTWAGALKRNIGMASGLPSVATLRSALDKSTYATFQNALESGAGTVPFHSLHNGLHGWFGFGSHMSSVVVSPFDPIFYLHHCNCDRLWAMWQMDGHATEYPLTGGDPEHHRNDPMYPWTGGAAGYSSNYDFSPITMPDFSALGVKTPADVLDHRALGYSYDTQAVIGVALDRTGSMTAMTPDPMTTGAPDITKWEAAKRGVSAFLQDCEAAYLSVETFVVAGVKTFRRLAANDFAPVFSGIPYGLIKSGGAYSKAAFDTAILPQSPGGSTPLADALTDTHATLVAPPFGWLPANERRYLAMLTDGLLTAGSPLSSIADGSLANTTVFAMGFGTGADVDYVTLNALVAKGDASTIPFHGENAGVIDKFYSQALAAAIGFTPVMDPVVELFEGEFVHLEFTATSAEDAFFLTAQGMDFEDPHWSYQLIGPDGEAIYTDGGLTAHLHGGGHAARRPYPRARRGNGRLSLFVSRDSADDSAWVGTWMLVIAWRARDLDAMVMVDPGELLVPVAAGPVRGPRYARLLLKPERRVAARAVAGKPRHRLDIRATSTNRSNRPTSSVVVNVYARTRLKVELRPEVEKVGGAPLTVAIVTNALRGSATSSDGFSRLIAPEQDLRTLVRNAKFPRSVMKDFRLPDSRLGLDAGRVLARLERRSARIGRIRDEELNVVQHHDGPPHVHVDKTEVPGVYHIGVWIEGTYYSSRARVDHDHSGSGLGDRGHTSIGGAAGIGGEQFARLLSLSASLPGAARVAGRRNRNRRR
jgi:Common central domain of tyrosinase